MAYRFRAPSEYASYRFSDAALSEWEGERNTDPGVANVVDGTAYLIEGVSLEGTYEDTGAIDGKYIIGTADGGVASGTATLPDVADVRLGEEYGITGEERTGTLYVPPTVADVSVPGLPSRPSTFTHYWFDWGTKGFWPVDIQSNHEPMRVLAYTSDVPQDNGVLLGCRDGYLRMFRPEYETDEGYEIVSYVAYGPIRAGGDDFRYGAITELTATLGEGSGPVCWYIMSGDSHEEAVEAAPKATGAVVAGRNYTTRPRVSGGSLMLVLARGLAYRRWAIETLNAGIMPMGPQRLDR